MRIPLVVSCLVLAGMLQAAELKQIDVNSTIKDVTVYKGLAEIRRVAKVTLPKGQTRLLFKSLPLTIQENTISAKAVGLKVSDVNMERVFLVESRQESVRKLEKEIDDLKAEESALSDKQDVLRKSLRFLESLNNVTGERSQEEWKTTGKVSVADWESVIKYTEENNEKKMKEIRQLGQKRSELLDQIAQKERTLANLIGPRYVELRNLNLQLTKEGKNEPKILQNINEASRILLSMQGDQENRVGFVVDAPEEKSYEVELVYHVAGADWTPLYDIRAFPDKNKIDMAFNAEIRQRTGEDWKNVNLTLSSSEPSRSMEPPVISFWQIQAGMPQQRSYKKKAEMMMNMAPAAIQADSEIAEKNMPMQYQEEALPVSVENFLSVAFPIPVPTSIPSGSDKLKVTIDNVAFTGKEVKLEYFVSPDRSDKVFLFTRVTNRMTYPLVGGGSAVYIDSDFIGQSYLPDMQPGEGTDLYLGSDPGLTAKKTLVKKFTDTSRSTVKISYHYRTTIKNLKGRDVELAVKDIIPVSLSDDVKIVVDSITPQPLVTKEEMETTEYKNGLRRWNFTLKPKEQQQIEMKFTVTYDSKIGAWPLR